ncbi:hypothetical protein ACFW04_012133 [Cataglyphis niger]
MQFSRRNGDITGDIGGAGLLNKAINALPFELHIPGYQFCGPGTRLAKRLARGDRGVNPLDAACREHDVAYSRSGDLADRHVADRALAERARERVAASDSTLGERAAATAIWATMKAKTKFGMGAPARVKRKRSGRRRTIVARKRTLSRGETRRLLTPVAVTGSSRFLSWRSGGNRESGERWQSDATAIGGAAAPQSRDGRSRFVPRALQTWKRCVFDEKKRNR